MEIFENKQLDSLPNEIWKDIVGYEGLYQISNLGRVKSLPKHRGGEKNRYLYPSKIMKIAISSNGYCCINLHKNKKLKRFFVHKLEAIAFLPRIDGKEYIDHINGIRCDNRIENLRWCSHYENDTFPLAKLNKSKARKKLVSTQAYKDNISTKLKQYYSHIENREKDSQRMKTLWAREDYKQRFLKNKHTEEYINHCRNTPLCKAILQFDMEGNFIQEFRSIAEAVRITHFSCIGKCCRGDRNHAGHFIWKFKEQYDREKQHKNTNG